MEKKKKFSYNYFGVISIKSGGVLVAIFSIDLEGRIKNFDLPKQKPLIPLFETIVNSIYAIEERQEREDFEGIIEVKIIREPQGIIPGMDSSINEVTGFIITDNGVGLDERNMHSFLQSDSTYRAEKGGKGVGRFSWLKAFEMAHIESVFCDDGVWSKRKFDFSLKSPEINDQLVESKEIQEYITVVELKNYYSAYRKNVPKKAETIANSIMQHCLIYLMSPKCPKIVVLDDERYCVNDIFASRIRKDDNKVSFFVGEYEFSMLHIKVEDSSLGASKLYLFANDRMVQEKDIEKEIVDLDKNLYRDKGFYYVGILSGQYLDENVETTRTGFKIPGDSEEGDVSIKDIVSGAKKEIEKYLSEYLTSVADEKSQRIQKYIRTEAPQFGHLLRYMPEDIATIKPNVTDKVLDDELYRIKRKFDRELKQENEEMIKTISVGATGMEKYEEKFSIQMQKISDSNKAALAEYVAHRKIVIELFKQGIRLTDNGKFELEKYIHNLIYPMRRTSEEIEYSSHNLWMIDERLAYCEYISSDIPFNNDSKEGRPDVLMLDNPVAVSDEENTGREYETIVILELKRPMRDDYTNSENPIVQMIEYVEKLKTNTISDKYGRPIRVGDDTQFYLYAVCDVTPKLQKIAKMYNFAETPDKLGMYFYNDNINAYIEILSFNKIIVDAEKRNKILFDKLGI